MNTVRVTFRPIYFWSKFYAPPILHLPLKVITFRPYCDAHPQFQFFPIFLLFFLYRVKKYFEQRSGRRKSSTFFSDRVIIHVLYRARVPAFVCIATEQSFKWLLLTSNDAKVIQETNFLTVEHCYC